MAAPLVVAAASTILRYLAKNGTKKAVQRYGNKAVQQARKEKGTKAQKSVENFREAKGKAHSAARKSPKSPVTRPTQGVPKTTAAGRAAAQKRIDAANKGPKRALGAAVAGATLLGGAAALKSGSDQRKAKASASAKATAKKPITTDSKRAAPSNMPSAYTVKKGDTLSAIAKQYGVRLSELRDANKNIKDLNKIGIGQRISLPKASIKDTGKSVYEGMSKSEMARLSKDKKKKIIK